MVTAEIISIGDELLIGQVVNTNGSWMGQQLNEAGIKVERINTIGDERSVILSALKEAATRVDIILITGGLGPTKDDITKQTLCEFFNTRLVFNQDAYDHITSLIHKRGGQMNRLNKSQADIPETCTPIRNEHGTAPGMWFEQSGKFFVSLPGVPFELQPMMSDYVIPELKKHFTTGAIVHKTLLTQGVPESVLAQQIEPWETGLPANIRLAYLPQPGMVRLRLSAYGQSRNELEKEIDREVEKLKAIIPGVIFGSGEDKLEELIGFELRRRKQTLSTAESCTGGTIAHMITSVPGSSDYFLGSVVAYSNKVKEQILGVSAGSLMKYGAVSERVVREMAAGVKLKFNADFALAVSGIAGPSGGTPEKPVGTTWIALATPSKIECLRFSLGENRERNIRKASLAALSMLWKELNA